MTKDQIETEFDRFFDVLSSDDIRQLDVKRFAKHIADMVIAEECGEAVRARNNEAIK